jgi:hypothetical protein
LIVVWFLSSMPLGVGIAAPIAGLTYRQFLSHDFPTAASALAGQCQPLLRLLAKEVVVGTMGAIFAVKKGFSVSYRGPARLTP